MTIELTKEELGLLEDILYDITHHKLQKFSEKDKDDILDIRVKIIGVLEALKQK